MFIQKSVMPAVFLFLLFLLFSMTANAGDFSWLEKLSIEARADSADFKVKLASRFKVGDMDVKAVLSNVKNDGDAYMVMRLSELSGHSIPTVLEQYKENKGNDWGNMAKRLGIKPGSRAFHNLKRGHDLQSNNRHENKSRGRGNSKGHGRDNNKGRGRGQH